MARSKAHTGFLRHSHVLSSHQHHPPLLSSPHSCWAHWQFAVWFASYNYLTVVVVVVFFVIVRRTSIRNDIDDIQLLEYEFVWKWNPCIEKEEEEHELHVVPYSMAYARLVVALSRLQESESFQEQSAYILKHQHMYTRAIFLSFSHVSLQLSSNSWSCCLRRHSDPIREINRFHKVELRVFTMHSLNSITLFIKLHIFKRKNDELIEFHYWETNQ